MAEAGSTQAPAPDAASSGKTICILTPDIAGPVRNGGIGTACAGLARLLTRFGYRVTILYALGHYSETAPIGSWIAEYAREGIALVACPPSRERVEPGGQLATAWSAWQWLKSRRFDLIYVVEWGGAGFFVTVAKHLGLAFADTAIVAGVHSPTLWHLEGNRQLPAGRHVLRVDHMERTTVALADAVISPSEYMLHWMLGQNWQLPERRLVIRNPVLFHSGRDRPGPGHADNTTGIDEIVFFGRLEPRKGIILFLQAVALLPRDLQARLKITLLGKRTDWPVDRLLLRNQAQSSGWTIIDDLGSDEALAYLAQARRLAVIPSLVENSPMTVVECLSRGLPFLASAVGGIPELLCEEDRDSHLFAPQPAALAAAIERAATAGLPVARPFDADAATRSWSEALASLLAPVSGSPARRGGPPGAAPRTAAPAAPPEASVVLVHRNRPALLRQALRGLTSQTFRDFEVVLVDDGSNQPDALAMLDELEPEFKNRQWRILRQSNRYLGAARNAGWRQAKGRFVLFHDDDNIAMPHQLATLLAAAHHSCSDIVTSAMAVFAERRAGPSPPPPDPDSLWVPVGNCLPLGFFENCFGDAQALVRREVLERLGGFSEDYGVGHEDWEFFARAAFAGFTITSVPEPLFWYRKAPDSMLRGRAQPDADYLRSAGPYLELLPPPLRQLLLVALASERQLEEVPGSPVHGPTDLGTRLRWHARHPAGVPRAMWRAARIVRHGGIAALRANLFPVRSSGE